MIASNTAMISVGILVVSFLGGIIFYYVIDDGDKKEKKYQLDQFLNVLIQFILYLWAAKIILQLPRLVQDPLSVLAYPSNSLHFFLASIFILGHLLIKYRHDKMAAATLFQTCSFIFLASLLLFDFIQLMVKPGNHLDAVTILLTVLVLVYVLFYTKYDKQLLGIFTNGIFLILACGIAFYKGSFMLFDFMIGPYYFLLLVLLLFVYVYSMYKHKLVT